MIAMTMDKEACSKLKASKGKHELQNCIISAYILKVVK
jgi:hypothetical protein